MGCGASRQACPVVEEEVPTSIVPDSTPQHQGSKSVDDYAGVPATSTRRGDALPAPDNTEGAQQQQGSLDESTSCVVAASGSRRRPPSSAGKLVVYQTEKHKQRKQLAAEARKKHSDDKAVVHKNGDSPKRGSALPPLRDRRSMGKSAISSPVSAAGGQAWEVALTASGPRSLLEEQEDQSIQQQMAQQYRAYEAAIRLREAEAVGWGEAASPTQDAQGNTARAKPQEKMAAPAPSTLPLPLGPPKHNPRLKNKHVGAVEHAGGGAASASRSQPLIIDSGADEEGRGTGESTAGASCAPMDGEIGGGEPWKHMDFHPDCGDQAARDEVSCIVDGQLYLTNFRGVERCQELQVYCLLELDMLCDCVRSLRCLTVSSSWGG